MLCVALGGSIPKYCSIDPELKAACLPSLQPHDLIQLLMGVIHEIVFSACSPPWGLTACWVLVTAWERGTYKPLLWEMQWHCSDRDGSSAMRLTWRSRWALQLPHRGCLER